MLNRILACPPQTPLRCKINTFAKNRRIHVRWGIFLQRTLYLNMRWSALSGFCRWTMRLALWITLFWFPEEGQRRAPTQWKCSIGFRLTERRAFGWRMTVWEGEGSRTWGIDPQTRGSINGNGDFVLTRITGTKKKTNLNGSWSFHWTSSLSTVSNRESEKVPNEGPWDDESANPSDGLEPLGPLGRSEESACIV